MSYKNDERRADLIQKYLNRELIESEQIELQNLAEQDPSVGKDISILQRKRRVRLADKILKDYEQSHNSALQKPKSLGDFLKKLF